MIYINPDYYLRQNLIFRMEIPHSSSFIGFIRNDTNLKVNCIFVFIQYNRSSFNAVS